MFLNNLTLSQQGALMHAAQKIMESDGVLHEAQKAVIAQFHREALAEAIATPVTFDELGKLFHTNREKFSFLLELMAVAMCDGEYHEKEKALIAEYANSLGVSDDDVVALQQWIEQELALLDQVERLLNK